MISILIIFSIFFQSLFVLTIGQTCRNLPVYARCSANPDCGCLPFSSIDDQSGVCAYLHLNPAKLRTCIGSNYYCDQPYTVCVHHPGLLTDKSLCYPTGMASLDICPPLHETSTSSPPPTTTPPPPLIVEEVCVNVSWSKQSITVAGSNYSGSQLHELRGPTAILFDSKLNTLYVADNGNYRIVTWQVNGKSGVVVAGNNGQGNRTDQLGWISSILMDPNDGSLILCDGKNRRIVRWSQRADHGEILLSNIYCSDLTFDDQGLLYVVEYENHRVTRWVLGHTLTEGHVVAGSNGKGKRLDQLYEPSSVFVDRQHTVYVADSQNDRVVKWSKDATEGVLVGTIRWPKAVHVSPSGNVYSTDGYYSRVMRWTPDNINGTIIAGETQYSLSQATDLAFDSSGNMFVSNYGNGRVYKFDINKSTCF